MGQAIVQPIYVRKTMKEESILLRKYEDKTSNFKKSYAWQDRLLTVRIKSLSIIKQLEEEVPVTYLQ